MFARCGLTAVLAIVCAASSAAAADRIDQLMSLGSALFSQDRKAEAAEMLGQAVDLAKQSDPKRAVLAMQLRGIILSNLERYVEADALLSEALAWAQRQRPQDNRVLAQVEISLGQLRAQQGKFAEAKGLLLGAIERLQAIQPRDALLLDAHTFLASTSCFQGKYAEAEKLLRPILPATHKSAPPALINSDSDTDLLHRLARPRLQDAISILPSFPDDLFRRDSRR